MSEEKKSLSGNDGSSDSDARNDRLLIEFLESNDEPCPVCGYNVRRLTKPVCPECQHRLRLTVGASDVVLKWFLVTIAPGMFSGIAAIFLAIPIIAVPLAGNGSAPWVIIAMDLFGFTSGIAALIMMFKRKRLVAMSVSQQRRIAALVWIIHATALLVLPGGAAMGWY